MENEQQLRQLIRECLTTFFENQPVEGKKDKEPESFDPEMEAREVVHELSSEGQEKGG